MAVVLPFKGVRFSQSAGNIADLVCPPYDIISEEQREQFLKTNPHNVIRLELPREGADVYDTAAKTLQEWEKGGILQTEEKESFYIYEESFTVNGQQKTLRGIVARVKLTDFEQGVVIPHENTLSAAKEDRFQLMQATGFNFSPVYCLFEDDDDQLAQWMSQNSTADPLYSFKTPSGIGQKMWRIDGDPAVTAAFAEKCLYIADGHHRYETALRYRNQMQAEGTAPGCDSVMMMLVPLQSSGLVVLPTHRVVHSIPNFNGRKMMLACRGYFHVGEMSTPEILLKYMNKEYQNGKISFGAYVNKRFFLLTLKNHPTLEQSMAKSHPVLRHLDVSVLHSLILEDVMGIDRENMARQQNLSYTRSIAQAVQAVDDGADCAFFLNPTRVEQIAEVGKAGQKMPQKSTYFYPKLITGLVLNRLK